MADSEKLYMQSPLVLWVETFKVNDGHPLEYHDLFDGVFLNDVMQQIDIRSAYDNVNRCVEDVSVRLHNWDLLVKNIRRFYSDVLQQLLVIRLPNINIICQDPEKETSFAEIRKALLLILGCAVQCEQKETFIDKIMSMDITAQTEIVENIKEVTDDCETIIPTQRPESPASSSSYIDKMFHHLYRLIRERDECSELATELGQDYDYYLSQAEGRLIIDAPQISPDKHHVALELAECKANLRQLRQQLEDRQECLSDLKDEFQESLASCAQLKSENALLVQEARTTRLLRDELDIMKEKASKVDMYEKEILKYKERLNEFEFYKARTAELKEDNAILEETKAMLEDQLINSRKRIETVAELESELGKYRQQIEELSRDRDSDKEKIDYLTQENARLELQRKTSMNESASLETELSAARSRIGDVGCTLSEQLSETSHTHILRMELENQRLASTLSEVKKNALTQNAEMSLKLEKENQKLLKKVEKLQSSSCKFAQQVVQMESELSGVREEKDNLVKALDTLNERSKQHIHELEKEIEQLSQALNQLRERSEKSNDLKVKDLERENKRLHETVAAKNSHLNKMEFENRQLQRSSVQLQEHKLRVQELEQENLILEKENADLHQKVATLEHTSDKLESIEQENSDISVEKRKLQKTVETLQAAVQRKEQLEQDHISLLLEHQRVQRMMETLKAGSDRALELESEKDDLNKELQQLQKLLDGQKIQKLKHEQMEFEVIDMGNENQRLQKNLEVTLRRLHQLEEDNMDIETDNEKITKELETLRVIVKRLENRDTEASQLEVEVQTLQKSKAVLEKENRKLKQASELKDSSLEDVNTKFLSLHQECKCLRQSVEKMKETCCKVKDLENENKELLQELNTDRRTLAALREELVNEKIRSQELSNQLDQLTGELDKIGIDTEKLTVAEHTKDANRYKALETMIEETLKKSKELKEEKIQVLETRLEQSESRNLKLQEDLIGVKSENEVFRQRLEADEVVVKEDVAQRNNGSNSYVKSTSANATKDILQLKDHLVELERQNATLLTETDNLRSNNLSASEQFIKLETQLSNLHSQNAILQGHYSSLREQNAKLQVEYTTLQAQIGSAVSQQGLLKSQVSHLQVDHENLTHKYESLQNTHQSLVTDHECLQKLHERLTAEYELLVSEHGCLKTHHKSLKVQNKDLQDQVKVLTQGKDEVNKLRDEVEKERDWMKREVMALGSLQSDYHVLREDHSRLRSAFDKLSKDYSDVLVYHKQIKTDYNILQLKVTELQGELSEARENVAIADMEFEKLENKMETIYHINERIENENQALLMQIKQLLNQNQELLTQALNSKDHFAEEEKAYMEKLSELRRQKERLEEKIMDNYKNRLSPKRKGLGALIARKARGIISRGPRRSKSRNTLCELLDSSSQGSGSTELVNDGHQTFDDIASLLSATSFLTGAKSAEDVNTSANSEGIHQPAVNTQRFGSKIQERSSLMCEALTMEEGGRQSTWNTAESNMSDDSCADELKALEPIHHRLNNERESQSSSEQSSTSSGRFQNHCQPNQQHLQDGLFQIRPIVDVGMSLACPTVSESHNSEIYSHAVGGDNEIHSIYSREVLSHQVNTSSSKSNSEASTIKTNSTLDSHVSSSRFEKNRKCFQTAATQNCLSENCERNFRGELVSYTSTTLEDVQPSSRGSGPSGNVHSSQPSPSHTLYHPLNQSSHHSQNTFTGQSRDERPKPTYPPPQVPTSEQLDCSAISVCTDDEPHIHYSQPYGQSFNDTGHSCVSWHKDDRHSRHNMANERGLGLERRRSQMASQSLIIQLPNTLLPAHMEISSSDVPQTLDNSVVSGYTTPNPRVHSLLNQGNTLCHARPPSTVSQSSHIRDVYSRPPAEISHRQQNQQLQGKSSDQRSRRVSGGQLLVTASDVNNSNINYHQPIVTERPKSVPPHLFYRSDDRCSGQVRDVSALPAHRTRVGLGTVSRDMKRLAPDGRDPRDTQSFPNVGIVRGTVQYSSQSPSHSLENQVSRQSRLQESIPHQQQCYNYPSSIDCATLNNLRQIGNRNLPSSHLPSTMQELPHCSPSQVLPYPHNNQASARPGSMDQSSLYSLGSLPLVHQDQSFTRSQHQQSREDQDLGIKRAAPNKSSMVQRSHSSVGSAPSLPSTSYGRSSTLGRCNIQSSQHDKDTQSGASNYHYDSPLHHSGCPPGPSSNFYRSPHDASRGSRQNPGNSDLRDILLSSLSEDCSFDQCQQLSTTSFNNPLSSNIQQSNHCQGSPQHHSPSKSDFISHTGGQLGGSQSHQTSYQQQVRSQQGKPSTNYQHDIPSNPPTPGELTSPGDTAGIAPSHPKVSPKSKVLQTPNKSENEKEGEQPPNTNSIWYEYGCV